MRDQLCNLLMGLIKCRKSTTTKAAWEPFLQFWDDHDGRWSLILEVSLSD